MRCKNRRLF